MPHLNAGICLLNNLYTRTPIIQNLVIRIPNYPSLLDPSRSSVENSTTNVNKNPTDATVCRYLFTAKSLYMFRVSQHPSSGVLKTVTAASGTGHNTGTATL